MTTPKISAGEGWRLATEEEIGQHVQTSDDGVKWNPCVPLIGIDDESDEYPFQIRGADGLGWFFKFARVPLPVPSVGAAGEAATTAAEIVKRFRECSIAGGRAWNEDGLYAVLQEANAFLRSLPSPRPPLPGEEFVHARDASRNRYPKCRRCEDGRMAVHGDGGLWCDRCEIPPIAPEAKEET